MDSAFELLACPARVPLPVLVVELWSQVLLQLYLHHYRCVYSCILDTWDKKTLPHLYVLVVGGNIGVIFNAAYQPPEPQIMHMQFWCLIIRWFLFTLTILTIAKLSKLETILWNTYERLSDFLRSKRNNMPLQGCMLLALMLKMCIFVSSDLVFWGLNP